MHLRFLNYSESRVKMHYTLIDGQIAPVDVTYAIYLQTEHFVVFRSVWPLDFASASRTTTRRSARASHTMSAIRRATTRSFNRNRTTTNRTTVEIIPKSRSRATTCRRTRSPPGIRWAPPRVRAKPTISPPMVKTASENVGKMLRTGNRY